ncbi:hypothetical protein WJX79_011044 [Trebouxia sp. C0005]
MEPSEEQESLHEPQPQALPYAAALVDPELSEPVQSVDQGIEHGLATSAATDQADVAYSQQSHPAEVVEEAGQTSEADAAAGAGASALKVETADTASLAVNNQLAEQEAAANKLPADALLMQGLLSLDSQKRNNIHLVDDHTLLTSAGTDVILLDLTTCVPQYICTPVAEGVGALAASADHRNFVVGEKSHHGPPNAYIYQYPSLTLEQTLEHGTEQAYSAAAFNQAGDRLATVGSYPDFMLTVWDWRSGCTLLRSKAFSQEVYCVSFCPYADGSLVTSGTGHIRFWSMARTFTGLKLQGSIGKFGNEELSDVSGYTDLPDGKVLCGAENGSLLMWSGALIKFVVKQSPEVACHQGAITVVLAEHNRKRILTAGTDGYVKLWDFQQLSDADSGEDSQYFFLKPLEEVALGQGVRVRGLVWQAEGRWLINDEAGSLIQVTLPSSGPLQEGRIQHLLTYHSGSIVGLAASPHSHMAITAGADGTVRLYDYRQKKELYKSGFGSPACSMLYLPTTLDSTARTVMVGFADGVVRALLMCSDAWKVTATFKPHSGAVQALALSPDCALLATTAQDNTVFLFTVASPAVYEPVGFFRLKQPASCLTWAPDSTKLLIGCSQGDVVEVSMPQHSPSASDTFELQIDQRHYQLTLPKAPGESAAAEGQNNAVQQPGTEDKDGCFPVYTLQYFSSGEQNTFLATAGGTAQGMVLKCSLEVQRALTAIPSHKAGVTALGMSQGGHLLLQGFTDGVLRVSEAAPGIDSVAEMLSAPHWESQAHDCQTGSITAMATSFDDSYLLSAAKDGTLYIHDVKLPSASRLEGQVLEAPAAAADPTPEAPLESGDGYSLEEARNKREEDKLLAAADAKKQGVRAYVQELRKEFAKLVEANAVAQLPESAFEVDPGLRDIIETQIKQEEKAVRQELAWESEKKRLAVAKLRKYFLDDLEVEHIVLHSFRSDKQVSSFKTCHLSADMLEELHRLTPKDPPTATQRAPSGPAPEGISGSTQGLAQTVKAGAAVPQLTAQHAAEDPAVSKQELRRLARKKREAELVAFSATRPDDSFESPADLQAIREAEHNMGDFKLKSDPEYVPPEGQRSTVDSKRRQMLLLDEAVYLVKMDFNKRFLALREVKKRVCQQVSEVQSRLREALTALGKSTAVVVDPVLKPEEVPELRDQVTEEDLEQYISSQMLVGNKLPGITPPHSKAQAAAASQAESTAPTSFPAAPLSELEISEQIFKNRKLEYRQHLLEKEVADMQEAFDNALALLRREKLSLEADVKAAHIKRLAYQQELQLLKDSQGRELELAAKTAGKHAEQAELAGRVSDCQAKLEAKLQDLRAAADAKQQVVSQFDELVEEGHAAHDALLKIFTKKIKRSKKKDEGLAAESSSDSDDDDDEDDDDEVEDSEGGEETCPAGCDPSLYDKVCELREARLDEEDAAMEVGRAMDALKKDRESLAKKERLMEQSLKAVNDEALAFQREKQVRLNQVEVVLLLRLHQIEYLQEGQLPSDLSGALLFSNTELDKLKHRVRELAEERAGLKAAQRQLQHEHVQLLKNKAATQDKLAELQQKAVDVQMLKFGQIIDLDLLDKVGSAKGVEELRVQLKQQEAAHTQELAQWDAQIRARNDELTQLTSENTRCLTAVADYTRSQMDMEDTLTNTQAHIFGDPAAQRQAEVAERDTLVQLVNNQAQQLETLRAQLIALRSKNTPVSP